MLLSSDGQEFLFFLLKEDFIQTALYIELIHGSENVLPTLPSKMHIANKKKQTHSSNQSCYL